MLCMTQDFLFYKHQKGPRKARCLRLEELLVSSDLPIRRINKGSDQLPDASHSGSGNANGVGDPIVLNDQSLFSDSEDSCSQSSESS